MGRQHYGGSLKGKWILTAGLGGMGGAQPLAASLAGACSLNIECQQSRIDMRLKTRYVDEQATALADAPARIHRYTKAGDAKSTQHPGPPPEILTRTVQRGPPPPPPTALTAGLGCMGGAQPLAASLAGACSLNIECQQSRIDMRLKTRYVDEQATDLDDALARIDRYTKAGEAKSIALLGNAAEILPRLVERGVRPDAVTDQTSAHDPVHGYLPIGWTVEQWLTEQKQHPEKVRDAAKQSMRVHVEAMRSDEHTSEEHTSELQSL